MCQFVQDSYLGLFIFVFLFFALLMHTVLRNYLQLHLLTDCMYTYSLQLHHSSTSTLPKFHPLYSQSLVLYHSRTHFNCSVHCSIIQVLSTSPAVCITWPSFLHLSKGHPLYCRIPYQPSIIHHSCSPRCFITNVSPTSQYWCSRCVGNGNTIRVNHKTLCSGLSYSRVWCQGGDEVCCTVLNDSSRAWLQ